MNALRDCLAPAKLNLFLHVLGRRPDGFHRLQTAFQLIDLHDVLHFERRADGLLRRVNEVAGVPADQDLVIRAARLLHTHTGTRLGVDIQIDKRLPMGGGLGGGSSDAATTLLALNCLWDLGLTRTTLMQLGLQLGADVPFFLCGSNAFAEGVGEELTPVTLPTTWFVIGRPPVSVPTPEIFQASELTRHTPSSTIAAFSAGLVSSQADLSKPLWGRNDLEAVASQRYPVVAAALDQLKTLAGNSRMTGSGSCVFAACRSQGEAEEIAARLKDAEAFENLWVARGLDAHPMQNRCS